MGSSRRLSIPRNKSSARHASNKKKQANNKKNATTAPGKKMTAGSQVWIPGDKNTIFERGTLILQKDNGEMTIKKSDKSLLTFPAGSDVLLVDTERIQNAKSTNDLVTLTPPNNGNILAVLKQRSCKEELPYTFVGPVLISVNPLKDLPDFDKQNGRLPHPHRIAEAALKQMQFAKVTKQPLDQSIIVSGESGAGKTEASKRVLQKLVSGKGAVVDDEDLKGKKSLDQRLLDTNPILEAFGNATTLRNRNSSRFGKLMKLNMMRGTKSINGATVDTYLLERSRVSGFVMGECNYHVFYQLMGGASDDMKNTLHLNHDFLYLKSLNERNPTMGSVDNQLNARPDKRDINEFGLLTEALEALGVGSKDQEAMFGIVSGILNLGNLVVHEDSAGASIDSNGDSGKCLSNAAELFGVNQGELVQAMCEKEVKAAGETMMARLAVADANQARHAIAKQMYSHLFNYIVEHTINSNLKPTKTSSSDAVIGVLDIFGFEQFQYNDLEQLLINFANQALHGIFLQKVFDAEMSMYVTEGLIPDGADQTITVPENVECMRLLRGGISPTKILGILDTIVEEGKNPGASDAKMVKTLHSRFGANKKFFPRPHPKDIEHQFKIKHFPGIVTYHIGNFLSKNNDRLPNLVDRLFAGSTRNIMRKLWEEAAKSSAAPKASSNGKRAKPVSDSIVRKFVSQIDALSETLTASQCSFIRCIKPNFYLERTEGNDDWFKHSYVSAQLRCLGIEPTVQVLSKGMPNRIRYKELTDTYMKLLPKESIKVWKTMGGGDKAFISALFYGFGISSDKYKLGFSRVFFKSGDLEELERVLEAAADGGSAPEEVGKRFKHYLVRAKWRKCLAVVMAYNHFIGIWMGAKAREEELKLQAAIHFQRFARGMIARIKYTEKKKELSKRKREKAAALRQKMEDEAIAREAAYEKALLARQRADEQQEEEGRMMMQQAMELQLELQAEELRVELENEKVDKLREEAENADREATALESKQKELMVELAKANGDEHATVSTISTGDVRRENQREEMEDDMDEGRFLMEQAMRMQQGLEVVDLQVIQNQREQERLLRKAARTERLRATVKAGELKKAEESLSKAVEQQNDVRERSEVVFNNITQDGNGSEGGGEKVRDALKYHREFGVMELNAQKDEREAEELEEEAAQADAEVERIERRREIKVQRKMVMIGQLLVRQNKRWAGKVGGIRGKSMARRSRGNSTHRSTVALKSNLLSKYENKQAMESFMERKERYEGKLCFWGAKRARKSQKNWRKRFFVLERGDKTLRYFSKDNGFENAGKRFKGEFEISERTRTQLIDEVDKHKYVLKISDIQAGDMYVSFDTPLERFKVKEEVEKCSTAQTEAVNNGLAMSRMPTDMSEKKKQKHNMMAATAQADEMLEQLVVMLHKGEITYEDYDAIIAGDVAQVRQDENSHTQGNRATSYLRGSESDGSDDDEVDEEDFGIQLPCQTCLTINNSLDGPHCRSCTAFLTDEFIPSGLFPNAIKAS